MWTRGRRSKSSKNFEDNISGSSTRLFSRGNRLRARTDGGGERDFMGDFAWQIRRNARGEKEEQEEEVTNLFVGNRMGGWTQ